MPDRADKQHSINRMCHDGKEPTMKEKKLYTCEICHTDYANPKDAEACEGSHKLTKGEGFRVEGV